MKRSLAIVVVLAGCGGKDGDAQTSALTNVSLTSAGTGGGETEGEGPGEGPGNGPAGSEDGPDSSVDVKFDLGENSEFCVDKSEGIYCDGTVAVECDGNGGATSTNNCPPAQCQEGEGCVTCLAGEFSCKGPRV